MSGVKCLNLDDIGMMKATIVQMHNIRTETSDSESIKEIASQAVVQAATVAMMAFRETNT